MVSPQFDTQHLGDVILSIAKGLGGKGKIDVQRFKGLGEMDAKDLKETTMDPATRVLLKVEVEDSTQKQTERRIESLMGRKPELRLAFIHSMTSRFPG